MAQQKLSTAPPTNDIERGKTKMGKLSLITIALLTLLTIPQAHGGTLLCKKAETSEFITVIFENSPSQELAGTFHAEMKSSTPLNCDDMNPAQEEMNTSGIAPTAAAACCSWSEGTLIPGCMPGC